MSGSGGGGGTIRGTGRGGGTGSLAFGAVLAGSSSAMILRMEARISSIEGS
jgi:hypothetical protein